MEYYSVFVPKEYGKIVLKFQEIMDRKGISRNKLAQLAGFRFEVANRLYKGEVEKIDLDVLARACYVLDCSVTDIMEYVK